MIYKYGQYRRNAGRIKIERWYRVMSGYSTYVERRISNNSTMWKIGSVVLTVPLLNKLKYCCVIDYHDKFNEALKHLR